MRNPKPANYASSPVPSKAFEWKPPTPTIISLPLSQSGPGKPKRVPRYRQVVVMMDGRVHGVFLVDNAGLAKLKERYRNGGGSKRPSGRPIKVIFWLRSFDKKTTGMGIVG